MRALWGRGLAISGENRGFTSAWILRYPILRSTQIIGSIEINSDVPAAEAGSFQTFRYCWKVRLHILALWFQTDFPHLSFATSARQIGLSTLRRIFTVRRSGIPQLCFTARAACGLEIGRV